MEKFLNYKRIKRVLFLDKRVYREIKDDHKHGMEQSVRVLVSSTLLGGVWLIFASFGIGLALILIAAPIGWILVSACMHYVAKLLGGKASFTEYLRVTGYAQAPHALGIFTLPGWILGIIWATACTIYATKEAHRISMPKAMTTVFIPLFVLSLLTGLFLLLIILPLIGMVELEEIARSITLYPS